jgi:hypothetical protein
MAAAHASRNGDNSWCCQSNQQHHACYDEAGCTAGNFEGDSFWLDLGNIRCTNRVSEVHYHIIMQTKKTAAKSCKVKVPMQRIWCESPPKSWQ